MTRFEVKVSFGIDGIDDPRLTPVDRHELEQFIISALETWGGQFDPDYWLRGSLDDVKLSGFRATVKR